MDTFERVTSLALPPYMKDAFDSQLTSLRAAVKTLSGVHGNATICVKVQVRVYETRDGPFHSAVLFAVPAMPPLKTGIVVSYNFAAPGTLARFLGKHGIAEERSVKDLLLDFGAVACADAAYAEATGTQGERFARVSLAAMRAI